MGRVDELSRQVLGSGGAPPVSTDEAAQLMPAFFLPRLIDRLTPNGQAPRSGKLPSIGLALPRGKEE